MKFLIFSILLTLTVGSGACLAQDENAIPGPSPVPSPGNSKQPPHPPDVPRAKYDPSGQLHPVFMEKHARLVERAKKGNIDLYFLGDSITERWARVPEIWKKAFGSWNPGNFGIGGDHTQNVLWRLENGELEGVTPKVVVLMIGTNNSSRNKPEDIARGIEKIVATLRNKLPQTKILVLGIFPRGRDADDKSRRTNDRVNAIIAKLPDDKHVFYLDIGEKFLQPDGTISREVMHDLVHLSPKGYEIWADAMIPKLTELMK